MPSISQTDVSCLLQLEPSQIDRRASRSVSSRYPHQIMACLHFSRISPSLDRSISHLPAIHLSKHTRGTDDWVICGNWAKLRELDSVGRCWLRKRLYARSYRLYVLFLPSYSFSESDFCVNHHTLNRLSFTIALIDSE